jgi:Leucine-rich repeat (LRR) protein
LERVPLLRVLNLNHNRIHRIHPEFFVQRGRESSGVEEIWLMDNDIGHVSEIRSILDASPRLKLLEASFNQIEDIGYGALRGHSSLERLHLDYNRLSFLQRDVFADMPALRELRLRNNSLVNSPDAPFWDLPALKVCYFAFHSFITLVYHSTLTYGHKQTIFFIYSPT